MYIYIECVFNVYFNLPIHTCGMTFCDIRQVHQDLIVNIIASNFKNNM